MKAFIPSKIAEVIFALIFAYFGYLHLTNVAAMSGAVPTLFPGDGKIWVYFSGASFILAAIAILTGVQKTLACYLLAAELLIFVFTIHLKNFDSNASGVLKDIAMAMCAILIGNRSK